MRLRSIVYKLIPGLYAKEQQNSNEINGRQENHYNGLDVAHSLNGEKHRQLLNDEDETLSEQYFYDQEEPIR